MIKIYNTLTRQKEDFLPDHAVSQRLLNLSSDQSAGEERSKAYFDSTASSTAASNEDMNQIQEPTVRMFVCGPTVYDYIHIGNARTYVAFDVIAKWLRYRGYNVQYLMNITDIEDKIIMRAKEQNISWQ